MRKAIFISFILFLGIYAFTVQTSAEQATIKGQPEGVVSPDGKKIAYVVQEGIPLTTKPYIYIFDVKTKTTEMLPFKVDYDFIPTSWSKDGRYLLLVQLSHYVGGLEAHVYDIALKRKFTSFPTLSEKMLWINNKDLVYTSPYISCEVSCLIGAETNLLDLNTLKRKQLGLNIVQGNNFPDIHNIRYEEDKIKIAYKSVGTSNAEYSFDSLDINKESTYE